MRLAWIAGLADLHKRWNIQSIVAPRVSPRVTPVQLMVLNVDWVFDYMFKTHAHINAYIILYIYTYVHILTHKLFLHLPVKKRYSFLISDKTSWNWTKFSTTPLNHPQEIRRKDHFERRDFSTPLSVQWMSFKGGTPRSLRCIARQDLQQPTVHGGWTHSLKGRNLEYGRWWYMMVDVIWSLGNNPKIICCSIVVQ